MKKTPSTLEEAILNGLSEGGLGEILAAVKDFQSQALTAAFFRSESPEEEERLKILSRKLGHKI